jgi:hypothetical protein
MSQPRVFIVGSTNIDLVMEVASAPLPGQTVTGGDLRYIPGGKGANQACSAAKMGASAFMVGQVGSDSFGELLLESLRLAGVETGRVGRYRGATGCASAARDYGLDGLVDREEALRDLARWSAGSWSPRRLLANNCLALQALQSDESSCADQPPKKDNEHHEEDKNHP